MYPAVLTAIEMINQIQLARTMFLAAVIQMATPEWLKLLWGVTVYLRQTRILR